MTDPTMRAWRLAHMGGPLHLKTVPIPEPRPGSVLVRIQASGLMSYLNSYVEGKLPFYAPPADEFTIGTNGVGIVEAVGRDVWHVQPGQRVLVSSHFVARDNVGDPAQILIGLTAGAGAAAMLNDWPDGTLADYALVPVEAVTPADGLEHLSSSRLATLSRFIIPYGGLLRGRLAAGETLLVTGATGAYGTAAVLLGLALGASRVVAAGRNAAALKTLADLGDTRLRTVTLSGTVDEDAAAIREETGGGVNVAFDMVGNATDPNATLAGLHSLRRGGRLVLMGSMTVDLPLPYTQLMLNDWEVLGQFMYPAAAYRRLLDLVRSGMLDITPIRMRNHALDELPEAMYAAANAGSFEYVVLCP